MELYAALDEGLVEKIDGMLDQFFLGSDCAPSRIEIVDELTSLFNDSARMAVMVFECLGAGTPDGDVLTALWVLYEMGAVELRGPILAQVSAA